MILVKIFVS